MSYAIKRLAHNRWRLLVRDAGATYWKIGDDFPTRAALVARASELNLLPVPKLGPRRKPNVALVCADFRLHPDTMVRIKAEAKRCGISQGRVIDRLALSLDHLLA